MHTQVRGNSQILHIFYTSLSDALSKEKLQLFWVIYTALHDGVRYVWAPKESSASGQFPTSPSRWSCRLCENTDESRIIDGRWILLKPHSEPRLPSSAILSETFSHFRCVPICLMEYDHRVWYTWCRCWCRIIERSLVTTVMVTRCNRFVKQMCCGCNNLEL